jgi:hypothetical protein
MMVVVLTEGMQLGSDVDQSQAITATAFGAIYQKRRCRPVTIDVALVELRMGSHGHQLSGTALSV